MPASKYALNTYMFVCLLVCLLACLFVCLFVYMYVCLCARAHMIVCICLLCEGINKCFLIGLFTSLYHYITASFSQCRTGQSIIRPDVSQSKHWFLSLWISSYVMLCCKYSHGGMDDHQLPFEAPGLEIPVPALKIPMHVVNVGLGPPRSARARELRYLEGQGVHIVYQ